MSGDTITIPTASDFHIHLRQDAMMRMIVPRIAEGGVSLVYVMVSKPQAANNENRASSHLQGAVGEACSQRHLSNDIIFVSRADAGGGTPSEAGRDRGLDSHHLACSGVKSYPRGVTTNSDSGIESYEVYYPVFKTMEEEGLVLNLHGEIPSDDEKDICVMNAEERFLPHLAQLHANFPNLKIVLEHATSKAAVDMVKSLGDTVACTITIHHLQLIVDDWAGQAHHFCKPVAKYPHDRQALREVVAEGEFEQDRNDAT
ncbi:hypothetical protein BC938DRAFT_483848 [Jimgerdemannia flammicorona]|uniref:Uncharacterized protein n=1 Tax=Jimgerdemannia flammicorona TaxID=994334 RepID=A0A433QB17_9FUNG|nr:hypothetical protein BC938DRAFT_483848 [Jimgerdemannia flammicorona]